MHCWEVLDLPTIINELLTFKCPSHSFQGTGPHPLKAFSSSVAHEIDHLSPSTIFFSLIESRNPISSEIAAKIVLLHRHSMTPSSIESVCQPWVNSFSFVCYQRAHSHNSVLRGVVKLSHSSQGHSCPHPGNINHRLHDGRPLLIWMWCVAVWHLLNIYSLPVFTCQV